MPSTADARVGQRVAAARVAHRMRQRDLAAAAHVSLSLLRKIEQGSRPVNAPVVQALADALAVDPERLTGAERHLDGRVHAAIPAVRAAAVAYDLPEDGPVRPLPVLRTAVQECTQWRLVSQYTRLAAALPGLLSELARAVHASQGRETEEAATLLALAYRAADGLAYKHGYHDLSSYLIERMHWAAARAGDALVQAAAAYVRTETFFATGTLRAGLASVEKAIDALPAATTADTRAARGALHMRAAVVAGRLVDHDTASLHLGAAQRMAAMVPEGVYHGTAFGPASVRVHGLSVAVELGDAPQAVASVGQWTPARELPAERRSHYYIDLARAQLWLGRREEALHSLHRARDIAPQHVREHPQVRHALGTLLRLYRRPPQALVSFAQWARAL